jgi:hypothetical protein
MPSISPSVLMEVEPQETVCRYPWDIFSTINIIEVDQDLLRLSEKLAIAWMSWRLKFA